jgi:hypothetical protein
VLVAAGCGLPDRCESVASAQPALANTTVSEPTQRGVAAFVRTLDVVIKNVEVGGYRSSTTGAGAASTCEARASWKTSSSRSVRDSARDGNKWP